MEIALTFNEEMKIFLRFSVGVEVNTFLISPCSDVT